MEENRRTYERRVNGLDVRKFISQYNPRSSTTVLFKYE